jgi:hypothetical protein
LVEGTERAELGTGEREIERDVGETDGKEGGGQVFIVVEKAAGLC